MSAAKPENRSDEKPADTSSRPCPICGKPAAVTARPFCSNRCADIDLHRWLSGVYTVPAAHEPDAEPDDAGEQ